MDEIENDRTDDRTSDSREVDGWSFNRRLKFPRDSYRSKYNKRERGMSNGCKKKSRNVISSLDPSPHFDPLNVTCYWIQVTRCFIIEYLVVSSVPQLGLLGPKTQANRGALIVFRPYNFFLVVLKAFWSSSTS